MGLLTKVELEIIFDEYWDLYRELWNDEIIDESDYESGIDYWTLEAQQDFTIAHLREAVEGVENPFCDEAAKDGKNDIASGMMVGFDKGKQAILKAMGGKA